MCNKVVVVYPRIFAKELMTATKVLRITGVPVEIRTGQFPNAI
jgi:hypothetical protein